MTPHPDPRSLGANCKACPWAVDGKPSKPVWGDGPREFNCARGVFVAEGPGPVEATTGVPLTGPTGKQFDDELQLAKLRRADFFVTNAQKCEPRGNKKEADMRHATDCCRPVLAHELKNLKYLPTFAMGKWAYYGLTKRERGVGSHRGFVRDGHAVIGGKTNLLIGQHIISWHPTFAFFKDPHQWGIFRLDMERFARLVNGTLRKVPELSIAPSVSDLHALPQLLADGRYYLGFDVESAPEHWTRPWTGKDPLRAKLRTVALANLDQGVSFVWGRDARLMKHFLDILQDPQIIKVGQNAFWFDRRIIYKQTGVWIPRSQLEDTRDARKAMAAIGWLNLGFLSTLYDDPGPWKEEDEDVAGEEETKKIVFTKDLKKLCRYNAEDAVRQLRVWEGEIAEPEWSEPRIQKLYGFLKLRSECAASMHTVGICVDKERRTQLKRQLASLYSHARRKYLEYVNIPGFEFKPSHLRALLFERHEVEQEGLRIKRFSLPDPYDKRAFTPTGQIAVNQKALLNLYVSPNSTEEIRKTLELYWQAKAPETLMSTFVDSELVDRALGADGRLRVGWNSCAQDLYRWSCSEPNIMNLKRPDKD